MFLRNIFNSALLSLFITAIIFKTSLSWWTALSPSIFGISVPIVVILGLLISYKLKVFSLTLSAIAAYFILSFLISGANFLMPEGILTSLQDNTVYFFIFFMLVEPKSSPVFRNSRIAYGVTAAILLNVLPFFTLYLSRLGIIADIFSITILLSNVIGRLYEMKIK